MGGGRLRFNSVPRVSIITEARLEELKGTFQRNDPKLGKVENCLVSSCRAFIPLIHLGS